jgi:hypothetical protein
VFFEFSPIPNIYITGQKGKKNPQIVVVFSLDGVCQLLV